MYLCSLCENSGITYPYENIMLDPTIENTGKVSVVICTYNGERYLKEQLDSILNQTYPISEILIQDDHSSDRTIDIIQEYQQQFSIIRLEQNEQNLGYNINFSSAIGKSTGDYIAISDQDDIWFPEKIEQLMKNIGDNLLIFSRSILFDTQRPDWEELNFQSPPKVLFEDLAFQNCVSGHSVLFRKELAARIPFWDKRYYYDWWLVTVAAYYDSISFFELPLTYWRRHDQSVTQQLINRTESSISKIFRLKDFLFRRKNYLQTLYRLLIRLDPKNKKHEKFSGIVKYSGSNNPFSIFYACCKCLRLRELYYPGSTWHSFHALKESFMKPIRCRGF